MELRGYQCEVEYDGEKLTARGTNKMAHMALAGQEAKQGDVILSRAQIAGVALKAASPMVNGRVTVTANDGRKFILHFRRKSNAEFAALAAALQS